MAVLLCANGAGEKMRINLTNAIDIWRDPDALKTCARKCAAPVICSKEAGIRAKFRIYLDLGEALQNLKHQLRVDRLVVMRPQAFADHQPAIALQGGVRLIQGKQKILGDVQHVDCVN